MKAQILRELRQLDQQFGTQAALLPIEISTRFSRTLGQYRVVIGEDKQKYRSFRFQARLANHSEVLSQVVRHEFIHYYLESQYQITGHGKAFRQLCQQLDIPARATLTVPPEFQQQPARYQLFCGQCRQLVGTRARLTQAFKQRLHRSVCRECHGAIVIIDAHAQAHNQEIHK